MTKPTDSDVSIRDAEMEQAYRIAALYVDRFWVRIGRNTTRICFGEASLGEDSMNFRVAVVMPSVEALKLATTLRSLADKLVEQVEAAAALPADAAPPA